MRLSKDFWSKIDGLVASGRLTSVHQVRVELERHFKWPAIHEWAKANASIFPKPTRDELEALRRVLDVRHFQQLISQQNLLSGTDAADPFLVAAAIARNACLVTEEVKKPNGARLPNVCEHFGIECINVAELYVREGWTF